MELLPLVGIVGLLDSRATIGQLLWMLSSHWLTLDSSLVRRALHGPKRLRGSTRPGHSAKWWVTICIICNILFMFRYNSFVNLLGILSQLWFKNKTKSLLDRISSYNCYGQKMAYWLLTDWLTLIIVIVYSWYYQ